MSRSGAPARAVGAGSPPRRRRSAINPRGTGGEDHAGPRRSPPPTRIAKVREQRREHPGLAAPVANEVDGNWEVAYFAAGEQVALVIVDPGSGEVRESWTGHQVAWKMARGYSGAFGHKLNAPYVFLPLCVIFLLGLVDWRRLRRVANLDLLVLLGFGVSHFFFNRAEIGVSVPLATRSCSTSSGARCGSACAGGARGCGRSGRWPGCWSPRCS